MTNPKLSVHKYAQDGESITKWGYEDAGNGRSLLQVQMCIDFVKGINILDERNSSISKSSSENTFPRPRLRITDHIDGRISALDFKT
jgi:hypothetical protein